MRDVRWNLMGANERFDTLVDLQVTSDMRVRERVERLTCPLTGQSVADAWALERAHLSPLPETLPTPFDLQVSRAVNTDSLVWFEGREYGVPFAYINHTVQVRAAVIRVDPAEDLFLALAVENQARLIVSGDQHLRALQEYAHVPIVTPGEAVEVVKKRRAHGGR